MSLKAQRWAWDQDLPPMDRLLLLAYADMCTGEGRCWPSTSFLARLLGVSDSTLRASKKRLLTHGLIFDTGLHAGRCAVIQLALEVACNES